LLPFPFCRQCCRPEKNAAAIIAPYLNTNALRCANQSEKRAHHCQLVRFFHRGCWRRSDGPIKLPFISGWVKRTRSRKWYFVAGALAQRSVSRRWESSAQGCRRIQAPLSHLALVAFHRGCILLNQLEGMSAAGRSKAFAVGDRCIRPLPASPSLLLQLWFSSATETTAHARQVIAS
jgi:hypothetical protein